MPFVFGYGSLVDRASVEATIRRPLDPADGPHPARLRGYRRAWNVAGHSDLRPDYVLTRPDGTDWAGWIVFLGIEEDVSATCTGAVFRLADVDLEPLDRRELSYDRVDVSHLVDPAQDEPTYTYVPHADTRERALAAGSAGTIMARYLRLVDQGYTTLGEESYAEHRATLPPTAPFGVEEIVVTPAATTEHNEIVDPTR